LFPFFYTRGAAQGEGLGNAFLSHISAVDGIFHVCRAFEDPDVTHVEDRIDPVGDLEIIHSELRLKDIERLTSEFRAATALLRNAACIVGFVVAELAMPSCLAAAALLEAAHQCGSSQCSCCCKCSGRVVVV
jgi:ribosome-binding ATPase YchF (GTP1/OBG family)